MKLPKNYTINADVLRVLAGFGVVLIHVTDPFLVYPPLLGNKGFVWEILNMLNIVFRFSVPMFIVISGMFILKPTKRFDFRKFYTKRFSRVGIPFVFWAIVYIVWVYFTERSLSSYEITTMILGANLDYLYFMYVIVGLYFVAPLFIIFIANTTNNIHRYLFASTVAFTLLITASGYIFQETFVDMYLSAFTIFLPFLSYFIAGFYLKDKALPKSFTLPFITLTILLVITVAFVTNGELTHYLRVAGSIAVMAYTFFLFMLIMQSELVKSLIRFRIPTILIRFAALSTFGVYLVHILIINLVDIFYPSWSVQVGSTVGIQGLTLVALKVIVVYALCILVTTIGRNIPYVKAVLGE